jgi:hypothetical protein
MKQKDHTRHRRRILGSVFAVALGVGTLVVAAPASALGSGSAACAPGVTFYGVSTMSQASTSVGTSTCGAVSAASQYRVLSGGSLLWSSTVVGALSAVAPVPGYSGGNRGEGGAHLVGRLLPGYTQGFQT